MNLTYKNPEIETQKILSIKTISDGILNPENIETIELEKYADPVTEFCYPWENKTPPKTEFRAVCDTHYFYFGFNVIDTEIVVSEVQSKRDILKEDRVEVFFSADEELKRYITLEIDPLGRTFSAEASYYRNINEDWEPEGLRTFGRLTNEGYIVKGALPIKELNRIGIKFNCSGDTMIAGIYRANFIKQADNSIRERWISWVLPDSEFPDFHIPSAFGIFVREEING